MGTVGGSYKEGRRDIALQPCLMLQIEIGLLVLSVAF